MDYQRFLQQAWQCFSENVVVYLVIGVVAVLLTSATMSLLVGPLCGGLVYMALANVRDGRKPEFGDIAYGFQEFGTLFFYLLVVLLMGVGYFLLFIPGLVVSVWWLFVLPLMVDRKLGFLDAMKESKRMVQEGRGFWEYLGLFALVFVLPIILIQVLSAILPFMVVLNLLVVPLQTLVLVIAYLDAAGEQGVSVTEK